MNHCNVSRTKYGTYYNTFDIRKIIPKYYLNLLNVKFAKPSVISNSVLQKIPLNKFNYSDKIDGEHTYLLIFDKKIFNVTNNNDIYQYEEEDFINMNFTGDCIIETEFYNGIYYIFDVYYLNGYDYSQKFLKERLNSINYYLNDLGPSFKVKKFHEIKDVNELLEYIKKDKSPEGNDIDGLILQRIDKPYFMEGNEPNCYKFKPVYLNTIDFLLKYKGNYCYDLYLFGDYFKNFRNNLKNLPKKKYIYEQNNIEKPLVGKNLKNFYEKILIYFDSPFYPNLGTMKLTYNWDKQNYPANKIELIDNLIHKMRKNPQNYNNSIIELSLTSEKKWVPLRIRKDKFLPNSYMVGLSNISVIFDQIKPSNQIYFQQNLSMKKEKLIIIHDINKIFRKYIIEEYINKYGPNSSIIDLCGGRGADLFNLYSNGVSNFFVIDNDTTALKRYFDRTYNINAKKYISLIANKFRKFYKPNWLNINFFNHKLDKNYDEIKKDLFSRYEFYKGKVDIVLMNFAIHYLCDDSEKIEKLCEFVQSVLFKNGIFILTYFDGDEILNKIKNNQTKIGPFDIKVIKEDKEKDVTIAKMPLPTIKEGDDIYVEEPLVKKSTIKLIESYFNKLDEFYIYDRCNRFIQTIEGFEEFIDYYKLIKVGIFYLK